MNLAALYSELGNVTDAKVRRTKACLLLEQLVSDRPYDHGQRVELARCYFQSAIKDRAANQIADAEAALQKAIPIFEAIAKRNQSTPEQTQELASAMNELGILYFHSQRFAEAEPLYRKTITLREQLAAKRPGTMVHAVEVGGSYCNMGHLTALGMKEAQNALEWYQKSISTLTPLLENDSRGTARRFLVNAHEGRAESYRMLKQYGEAAHDFDRVTSLDPNRTTTRIRRNLMWAKSGEHLKAAADTELLVEKASAEMLIDLAGIWAQSSTTVKGDIADRYALRGVRSIREGIGKGYQNVNRLNTDSELEPLRSRTDFNVLLEALKSKPSVDR